MSARVRSVLTAAAVLLAGVATAAPAALAGGLAMNEAASEFPQRAYTVQVPERTELDPGSVRVSENGEPIGGVRLESTGDAGEGAFGTVLVIDASNSMEGLPIEEAMRAARAFAERRAPEHELAVVAFNASTDVLLPLTSDEEEIAAALADEPVLGPATHVYDATTTALAMLSDAGVDAGSVIVLSDGADNGSAAGLADVAAAARGSGVRVFSVGLRSEDFDPETLEGLAVGGAFADAARPQQLASIFDRFGAELASEYLIRYRSGAKPGESITVEVEVDGVPGTARASYKVPRPNAAPNPREPESLWSSPTAMVAAIALAAALLGLAFFLVVRPRRVSVGERLARFVSLRPAAKDQAPREQVTRGGLLAPVERRLERADWWVRFKEELEIAEIRTAAIHIVAATMVGTALMTLLINETLGVAILAPLALLFPFGVRRAIIRKLRKRRREFADQLADNLQALASALRSGQSMAGALSVVVEEAAEPTRGEFRRIVNDERAGIPLEDAIRDVGRRMANRDLEQLALVAIIQRETGGNTAELLDRVVEMIRERGSLRRLMETLTAQGRLSQVVISAVPVVVLVAVTLVNRDYLEPLLERQSGHILLGVAAALSIVGTLLIKRIVEVRV